MALKGGLVVTLALSLGGYTVAESQTQAATVAGLQAQAQAEAAAQAEALRLAVEAERQRAVATAEAALADAVAVQSVASADVAEADLASLTQAVTELNALLVEVPLASVPGAVAAEDTAGSGVAVAPADEPAEEPAVDRQGRASRAAGRGPVPTEATPAPDPTAEAQVEAGAEQPGTEPTADATAEEAGVADATDVPVPADDPAPQDGLSAEILTVVARVTEQAAQVSQVAKANAEAKAAAAAAAAEAERQAAAAAAAAAAAEAARKEAQRVSLDAYANGRIPAEALCDVPSGHQLRCDAAEALGELNAAYQAAFGAPLVISDSYRSYAAQVACVRVKGGLCAAPGTSNHGLGLAVDLAGGIQTFGTRQHAWMAANAGAYGWDLPDWASRGGSKPEPWHWEYVG